MTSLNIGYRNYFQQQLFIQQKNKEHEDQVKERELSKEHSVSVEDKDNQQDIDAFLAKLQQNRAALLISPELRQQMLDEIAALKLRVSNALQEKKLESYQSNVERVHQEIKVLTKQLAQLLAAQTELEEADNKATDTSGSLSISAAVKKAMLRQATINPLAARLIQRQTALIQSTAQENWAIQQPDEHPLLRSAPVESSERVTYATEGPKDDITTIGQDKMTPEEKLWHELSLLTVAMGDLQDTIALLNELLSLPVEELKKRLANGVELKELETFLLKFHSDMGGYVIDVPEGLDDKQLKALMDKAGLSYEMTSDGKMKVTSYPISNIYYAAQSIKTAIREVGSDSLLKHYLNLALKDINICVGDYKKNIELLNANMPNTAIPETDNSTLSDWLQGMLPGFESIDKSNINFYKSVIALITAWQKKINEFNNLYAEVLKGSSGVDQSDGKHRFDVDAVDKMLAALDEITDIEHKLALVLGNVNETDLANLLEGTGINYSQKIGTVVFLDIGSDVAKLLKDAVKNCYSTKDNDGKKYVVTQEQLTQFNSVLTQAQNQFDTMVKKVNTKTDSAKSLYNDVHEALSGLLKSRESLCADLMKMLR